MAICLVARASDTTEAVDVVGDQQGRGLRTFFANGLDVLLLGTLQHATRKLEKAKGVRGSYWFPATLGVPVCRCEAV